MLRKFITLSFLSIYTRTCEYTNIYNTSIYTIYYIIRQHSGAHFRKCTRPILVSFSIYSIWTIYIYCAGPPCGGVRVVYCISILVAMCTFPFLCCSAKLHLILFFGHKLAWSVNDERETIHSCKTYHIIYQQFIFPRLVFFSSIFILFHINAPVFLLEHDNG